MIQVFTGVPYIGEQNNTHLNMIVLEKTAYAEDDTVVLTATDANIRLNTSYTWSYKTKFC